MTTLNKRGSGDVALSTAHHAGHICAMNDMVAMFIRFAVSNTVDARRLSMVCKHWNNLVHGIVRYAIVYIDNETYCTLCVDDRVRSITLRQLYSLVIRSGGRFARPPTNSYMYKLLLPKGARFQDGAKLLDVPQVTSVYDPRKPFRRVGNGRALSVIKYAGRIDVVNVQHKWFQLITNAPALQILDISFGCSNYLPKLPSSLRFLRTSITITANDRRNLDTLTKVPNLVALDINIHGPCRDLDWLTQLRSYTSLRYLRVWTEDSVLDDGNRNTGLLPAYNIPNLISLTYACGGVIWYTMGERRFVRSTTYARKSGTRSWYPMRCDIGNGFRIDTKMLAMVACGCIPLDYVMLFILGMVSEPCSTLG